MPEAKESILRRLLSGRVVAIVRLASIDPLLEIARALVGGGITCVELTLTTPRAFEGISWLSRDLAGSAVIGAGSVLDVHGCREAVSAGAQFIVSPAFDPDVHAMTQKLGKVSIPGALTPAEIIRAHNAGADIVKVFPSAQLGPGYFRDLLAPLPHVRLMPTGGVDIRNAAEWLRAGAVCLGAGSNLVPRDIVARKDWPAITALAQAFMEAVRSAQ